MSRASILASGRRAAEAGMIDACTISRLATTVTDPVTGVVTDTTATVYTGRCRVQQAGSQGARLDAGQQSVLLLRFELQLPMSVVGLTEDDVVTITASVHDGDLVGRKFRIQDLAHKTEATARRMQVTEVT